MKNHHNVTSPYTAMDFESDETVAVTIVIRVYRVLVTSIYFCKINNSIVWKKGTFEGIDIK